ncbi:MAG: response regulator transcription factor [Clostridium sp.]|nr:response regulator transcription factor [Clostridium sp.]
MKSISVLMVEDHKLLRVGLKSLFNETEEIKVIAEAETAKEAVDKAKVMKPDVILMDIGLPDMSGIEATKRILNNNVEQKIMMLTSHINEKEVMDSLSAGAYAYVLKDINTELLTMVIKSVSDGAIWLDPQIVPLIRDKSSCFIPQKQNSRAAFRAQHANLTEREYEVLKLVVDGQSNSEIANTLTISEHTAKAHVCNIIQKLVVDDRTQAAVKAIKEGLV